MSRECVEVRAGCSGEGRSRVLSKLAIAFLKSECKLTMVGKVVQLRHVSSGSVRVTRVWQAGARIPQLIEERVNHSVDGRQTLCWRVFEQFRDQIDRIRIGLSEHLSLC
jgi:hypothetical protein